ncbi:hypothetical protein AMECASPLE_010897 [Ameca splendens]|uniref:Uncharacterized protein n=1 Tax=Ameca splendens TaxID=208324 RepID=A0ABV0YMQ6_9TELE
MLGLLLGVIQSLEKEIKSCVSTVGFTLPHVTNPVCCVQDLNTWVMEKRVYGLGTSGSHLYFLQTMWSYYGGPILTKLKIKAEIYIFCFSFSLDMRFHQEM